MTRYDLGEFKNGKAFIHQDDKNGYGARICINTKGEKLFELPNKNMIVNEFEPEDVAFVMGTNGLYALLNNKGQFLTDFVYNGIYSGSEEGFFEVKRNGKHGHIDINGKEIIPCMYNDGCYFSEGVVAEYLNGKCGMVDCFNHTVIPFEYEEICICKNNLINAKKNGKYGLINKFNEVIVDFKFDEIDCWQTRECIVYPARIGDKWGLIDRYENTVEKFIYDDAQLISDNEDNAGEFIILLKGELKAIYSTKKKGFITDFIYNFVGFLSENRFIVCANDKAGFVDIYGETITPLVYDSQYTNDFSEGVCVVYKDNKAGIIDLTGELIVPCIYEKLENCKNGLILATNSDGQKGYINKKGEIVIPFGKYYFCYNFNEGYAVVTSSEYGHVYIDKTGKILNLKIDKN